MYSGPKSVLKTWTTIKIVIYLHCLTKCQNKWHWFSRNIAHFSIKTIKSSKTKFARYINTWFKLIEKVCFEKSSILLVWKCYIVWTNVMKCKQFYMWLKYSKTFWGHHIYVVIIWWIYYIKLHPSMQNKYYPKAEFPKKGFVSWCKANKLI